MMHVLICEDDIGQRTHIESIIGKHIATENVEIELILSSGDPTEVQDYLKAHPNKRGLYFLDIDLQHNEINGFDLAIQIRETDPQAKIVFITTHSELAHLTFQHKIAALDYIVKDSSSDIELRTIGCVQAAYARYLAEKSEQMRYFKIDANGEVWSIPYDDILFFETSSKVRNKIVLCTEYSEIDFRGTLNEIAQLIPEFYRCHKSYLLNLEKVVYVDKITKEAVMPNGSRPHISERKLAELIAMIGSR